MALGSAGGITDTASALLAVARAGGVIELLNPYTGELRASIPPASTGVGSQNGAQNGRAAAAAEVGPGAAATRLAGLHLLWGGSSCSGGGAEAEGSSSCLPSVLSVFQGGMARLLTWDAAAAASATAADGSSSSGGGSAWREVLSWATPAQVCCTAYDSSTSGGTLAVGCQGAELRLFDTTTGQLAWAAKGGRPNMVGLVDKPWNTALAFLPPASSSSGSRGDEAGGPGTADSCGAACGSRLLVGTGRHKVRLYDASAGKRPQMELR